MTAKKKEKSNVASATCAAATEGTPSADERKAAAPMKVLTMKNGKRYRILDEDGKYYYVEGSQIRKSNPEILHVKVR